MMYRDTYCETKLINFIESSSLPTDIATFTVHAFTEINNGKDHLAITMGNISESDPVLARIHSQCITGESLFSLRCDCRFQLTESLQQIAENGSLQLIEAILLVEIYNHIVN